MRGFKFARFVCYGCRQEYAHVFPASCHELECPCGQWNIPPATAQLIDGRCPDCEKPLDDHRWQGLRTVGCP